MTQNKFKVVGEMYSCLMLIVFLNYLSVHPANPKSTAKSKVKLQFVSRTTQDNQEVDLVVGSDALINCMVKTSDGSELIPPKMTWLKDDSELHKVSYRYFPENGMEDVYALTLKNIIVEDSGKYKCTADNGFNKAITTSIVLNVKDKVYNTVPEIKEFSPLNPVLEVGQSITFSCSSTPIPDHTPMIQWVKHSKRKLTILNETSSITNSTNTTATPDEVTQMLPTTTPDPLLPYTFSSDRMINVSYSDNNTIYETIALKMVRGEESSLVLNNVTFEDTGVFTCYVFNHNGYQKKSTNLAVVPVPPLSADELERLYFKRYGTDKFELPIPTSVLVALPLFLLVILIIGCVWWNESQKRLNEIKVISVRKHSTEPLPIEKQPLILPEINISNASDGSLKETLYINKDTMYDSGPSLHLSNDDILYAQINKPTPNLNVEENSVGMKGTL